MKKIYLGCWLLLSAMATLAQVGGGSVIGQPTPISTSAVGAGNTLAATTLPVCDPTMTTCATDLPVSLLDFAGHRENPQYVDLQWKTTNELSNAGFWVERSFGDGNNFKPVFFVPADTTAALVKLYERPDTNAYSGKTWYRLEQIDLDGKGTYSKQVVVDGSPAPFVVYPNPSRGMVYLRYPPAASGQPYEVRVYNGFGQLVFGGRTTNIDLSGQSAGIYTIEYLGDTIQYARVVILR